MKYHINIKSMSMPSDMETPVGIYLKIRDMYPESALLESSDYHTFQNSTSYIGVEAISSFTVKDGQTEIRYPDGQCEIKAVTSRTDVPDALRDYIARFKFDCKCDMSGLFGFTAYDAIRYFEKVPVSNKPAEFADIPDMKYIMYRYIIRVNHYRNTMTLIEHNLPGQTSNLSEIASVIRNNNIAQYGFKVTGSAESTISDEQYKDMVRSGISHARRGDVFQVVLSRRFSQPFHGDDFNVYRALRCINPSPYLFYFDFGNFRIFGSSPETHLRVKGNKAYIDPIAGTFKRTGDDARDHDLAQALLLDRKENAEHIMLVDLARNDLSRSGGNTEIEFLRQIQYYSHVIHMVSRVSVTLPDGADPYRLFAATFPAGTLSGAPKVRAMQLIDELEPHSRMTYGGCIGYIGFDGDLNQAITIRSFLSTGSRLYYQSGAGIVAESDPEKELQETANKSGALVNAIFSAQQQF